MKVPPKRKGNRALRAGADMVDPLNESPSEKEGKLRCASMSCSDSTLNESPSEKEGKFEHLLQFTLVLIALNESPSEKEGKSRQPHHTPPSLPPLNESPSEKEGKSDD